MERRLVLTTGRPIGRAAQNFRYRAGIYSMWI